MTVGAEHVVIGAVSGLLTLACVFVHYEMMSVTSSWLAKGSLKRRLRVFVLVLAMLVAHVIEVWVFALGYWNLDRFPSLGALEGAFDEGALDFVYFSVVSFTTIGYGDMVPTGALRILAGTEALVGLSLITWSASLTFLEMQRDWIEFQRP